MVPIKRNTQCSACVWGRKLKMSEVNSRPPWHVTVANDVTAFQLISSPNRIRGSPSRFGRKQVNRGGLTRFVGEVVLVLQPISSDVMPANFDGYFHFNHEILRSSFGRNFFNCNCTNDLETNQEEFNSLAFTSADFVSKKRPFSITLVVFLS
ncbi:hypothetical protein CDAR_396391 [Caerostris darwini]|uniref:Uncharacterized protein n=1 Tax=Caerostris darwini TaxID=1538125 RepID=A0AAV4US04_9ARAC|nr:hypothetical protein CDAR_396391 [Caerostris darwini]